MKKIFLKNEKAIIIVILIVFGVSYRILDYPPNFTPIVAIAMFGSYYFRGYLFFLLPISIMLVSDFFIGFYEWKIMLSIYLSIALISFFGLMIRKKYSVSNIVQWSFLASLVFFVISNTAVWLFTSWYPSSLSGLLECFYLAIPFFKNTLAGDMFFNTSFFGAYAFYNYYKHKVQESNVEVII